MYPAIAEVVFFVSYFIAWVSGELVSAKPGTDIWLAISAWAALIVAVAIVFANRKLIDHRNTSV